MHLEMLASSTGEVWLMGVLLLIGASFLLYGKGVEFIFVGMVVIGGIVTIAYSNHSNYLDERFTLQRFNEGRALACGMWRGEGVRVDLSQGWVKEKGVGFVKGDVIVNDIGVCRVIGEKTPEPSSVPYWMAFVSTLAILLTLRAVTLGILEEDHDARAE
jgi:hypothetical protein